MRTMDGTLSDMGFRDLAWQSQNLHKINIIYKQPSDIFVFRTKEAQACDFLKLESMEGKLIL